ncbi:MAG TPA: winged helix-turn-helix domain-containing protein [Ideonella sp.]|uniref:ATP-binding protein n=1 Tax=Ideonella sp. TaxID=1929293 RepID=UPI002BD17DF9|nr:winged helix-turn-helix domain-containing protein [Ideonella sp.]HSI48800.1 winged helix-turn-helix domain-containing protein [Ideonella sp.]
MNPGLASDPALSLPQQPQSFERPLRFGRFSLDPARKLLLDDGQAVRLGSRALDLLIALVERAGEVVSHDELFARVWPSTVVEASSLRVHMSALRRALGEGSGNGELRYIASLPGRGYCFVMDIADAEAQVETKAVPAPRAVPLAASLPRPFPSRLTGVVGREQVLARLSAKLQQGRLVTVVGPGGIGKTTVALAVAQDIAWRHAEGAVFVDLAPLVDPALVPATLAAALGIPVPAQSPWPALEATLAARDLLIVLDNCEHLIAAAAALAERVLTAAPRVRVLATSREPLDAESEAILRLEALGVPPEWPALDVQAALAYPALRLFVERAAASDDRFALSPANLPAVVRLCRHLDGLPLAIELAAARVGSLGIHALAERLDDLFRLLRRGRRTVLPRHQTLQALLDWSHGLLAPDEQRVLHRLSVFRSSFTLEVAGELASCEHVGRQRVMASMLNLVSKSLLELEVGEAGKVPRYRLLFVARLYASGMLAADGDAHEVGRRHAICCLDLLAAANADLEGQRATLSAWLATHAPLLPDVRAALDWAERPGGDRLLGAALLVESGRLVQELGLNDEFLPRTLRALTLVRAEGGMPARLELGLLTFACALDGQCSTARDPSSEIPAHLEALARRIGSAHERRTALLCLCANAFARGDYPRVAQCAARYASLPPDPDDPTDLGATLVGRRFDALARHYLGDHRAAWADSAYLLQHAGSLLRGSRYPHMPVQMSMGVQQARILWLEGASDRALQRALEVLAIVEGGQHFAVSQALALAVIPILLWRGDDAQAATFLDRLVDSALGHGQSFWLGWSDSYCKVLALRGQAVDAQRRRIGAERGWTSTIEGDMLATLVPALAGPAQLARVEAGSVGWCAPEVLRAHGEQLLAEPALAAQAEPVLLRALALARQQGARAWALRAACSLATLWHATGRGQAARELLAPVVAGFTEGLGCVDVQRARRLLVLWDGG